MKQSYNFNALVEWKYALLKMKKISILCDGCKERISEKIRSIEKQLQQMIDEGDGVI